MKTLTALVCAGALALSSTAAVATDTAPRMAAPQMSVSQVTLSTQDADTTSTLVMAALIVGVLAVASASGGTTAAVVSDERLKTDITRVGTALHGLPVYEYRYIGQPEIWRGVMAQDVREVMPEAVIAHESGILMVNYAELGMRLERVN